MEKFLNYNLNCIHNTKYSHELHFNNELKIEFRAEQLWTLTLLLWKRNTTKSMKLSLAYNLNIIHNTNVITLCYSGTCTLKKQRRKQFYHI
jgi:hypothetical protein